MCGCEYAANGHTADTPRAAMNSRRFMCLSTAEDPASYQLN
jgi:hypothetical protein